MIATYKSFNMHHASGVCQCLCRLTCVCVCEDMHVCEFVAVAQAGTSKFCVFA